MVHLEDSKIVNRKVISEYSIQFLDNTITNITSVLLVSYLMFVSNW